MSCWVTMISGLGFIALALLALAFLVVPLLGAEEPATL